MNLPLGCELESSYLGHAHEPHAHSYPHKGKGVDVDVVNESVAKQTFGIFKPGVVDGLDE